MKEDKTAFYIVAIVAVIAVVLMVIMVIHIKNTQIKTTITELNNDEVFVQQDNVGYAMSKAMCCATFQTKTCCRPG